MKKLLLSLILILSVVSAACTMNIGDYGINSHFAYPNSNITPLGQVKASTSKISFIISPSFDEGEIIQLTQEALAQKPEADLLLNYTLDTSITILPLITKMEITIEGTAAKMDVGSQELQDFYDKIQYQAK